MTLTAAGGLMVLGGTLAATRPIQDAFGLIRVSGIEGVHGSANGQALGATNARGDLPVPSLLPYFGNRLAIAGDDLPGDVDVDTTERVVAPPLRGGALIRFAARQARAVTGIVLIEAAGTTRPPTFGQLRVTVQGQSIESPIGKQGEFYLEDIPPGRHEAVIEWEGEPCRFTLEIPASDASLVRLGTLRCGPPARPRPLP